MEVWKVLFYGQIRVFENLRLSKLISWLQTICFTYIICFYLKYVEQPTVVM